MDKHWVATEFGQGIDSLQYRVVAVPPPGPGEVAIDVRAVSINRFDTKVIDLLSDDAQLPYPLGAEASGVIAAIGPALEVDSEPAATKDALAVGDEVLTFRARGAYATRIIVKAKDAYKKPASLSFAEAAGLLLVGTTAAEMLYRVNASRGDTVLLHGASGALGESLLQQAAKLGVNVIGTSSERNFGNVRRYGGTPIAYGDDLSVRVREAAPEGVDIALDAAGTVEAIDVSLEFVFDRRRILTVVRGDLAKKYGFQYIDGSGEGAKWRDSVSPDLIAMAGAGELEVPIARTFGLSEAKVALEYIESGRAGGKIVLLT